MNIDRIRDLECTDARLTEKEIGQGYHFCPDWDYMVVGPMMPESQGCFCLKSSDPNTKKAH